MADAKVAQASFVKSHVPTTIRCVASLADLSRFGLTDAKEAFAFY